MSYSSSRIARIRAHMAERGLDALFVRQTSNIAWASGFKDVFDEERAHALIVTSRCVVLHTDSRYSLALDAAAHGTQISIDDRRVSHADVLVEVLGAGSWRVGIEDSMTLAEFRALEKRTVSSSAAVDLVETNRFVESLREVKDEDELACMRRAQAITDAAFAHIVDWMRCGMTESQVQRELDRRMFELGAQGLAFDTIVAAGAHGASPHARPGETVLKQGDAVVMDFGARWGGYCSDMTRTVFIGEPSARQVQAWESLRRANESVEETLRAGVTGAEAHALAERILEEGGFGKKMGHALGHSVGLDIHESPNLAPANVAALPVGAVVTVEPGIYLPGEFGMRLEDFGVIGEDGFEVFTQSTHEMVIIRRS